MNSFSKKSKFYIQPSPTSIYVSSISHDSYEIEKMEDSETRNRCKSFSNLNESKLINTNSNSSQNSGTFSKFKKFFKNPKKPVDQIFNKQDNVIGRDHSIETIRNLFFDTENNHVVKILPSPRTTFALDENTRNEIYKKMEGLSDEEKIDLQKKSLEILKRNVELKKKNNIELQKHINELKTDLELKRQPIRSRIDIENLKAEIRNLTNEKAELEKKIIQTFRWKCWKCTYENKNENSHCDMCRTERHFNEFILCKFCSHKNSLSSISCQKCNNYIDETEIDESNGRIRQSSSNSSSSSSINKPHSGSSLSPEIGTKSSPFSSPNISLKQNYFRPGQINYNSQTSSSSNNSVFIHTPNPQGYDNSVYFSLSSSNLCDENRPSNLPPRSPNMNAYRNILQDNNNQPTIPVVIDDDFKRKNNKKKTNF